MNDLDAISRFRQETRAWLEAKAFNLLRGCFIIWMI